MMSASEWLDYARLAKYNMGAYGNRDAAFAPSYEADRFGFRWCSCFFGQT